MPAANPSVAPFLVLAATPDGGRSFKIRHARDERHLADLLRRDRLIPVQSLRLPAALAAGAGTLSLKDQSELHNQLAQLLTRGVPLVEALEVTQSCVSARAKPLVAQLRDQVVAGTSFADACAKLGGFDTVTIAVYRAAERTGDMGGAAKQLATTARRTLATRGKIATLLMYPVIVLTISLLVASLMLTVIVPRIGSALKSAADLELPWYSALVIDSGEWLRDHWMWVLAFLALLVVAAVALRKPLGVALSRALRTLPLFRDVVLAQESARFFTVMAAMSRSGVTLGDALGVGVGAVEHPRLRQQLTTLRQKLVEGGMLRTLLERVDVFPVATRRLLIAAERSGDLQSAFDTLAQDATEELDRRSSRLMAAMEPLLIVGMFLVIGSLLLSIMIPLMKLSQQAF